MDWLNHPLTKHPITLIVIVAVLIVAGYFAFSPYEKCARAAAAKLGYYQGSIINYQCRNAPW